MVTDLDMVIEASIACVEVRSESKQESQHNENCEILVRDFEGGVGDGNEGPH